LKIFPALWPLLHIDSAPRKPRHARNFRTQSLSPVARYRRRHTRTAPSTANFAPSNMSADWERDGGGKASPHSNVPDHQQTDQGYAGYENGDSRGRDWERDEPRGEHSRSRSPPRRDMRDRSPRRYDPVPRNSPLKIAHS
jgi:hypothetical protein